MTEKPTDWKLQDDLDRIAVDISLSDHGDFLKAFALAWQMADEANKSILTPAWLTLIRKYTLEKGD